MDSSLSSVSCELKIIRAKNTGFNSTGHLFVRCYLSAENNKRVRINSREISSKSDLFWNESFSLDCKGTQESMDMLMQGTVIFELRWRNTLPVFVRIGGSLLLARAEVPWKSVSESPNMELEKWVVMIPKRGCVLRGDVKPPAVQIWMKVQSQSMAETARRRNGGGLKKWNECRCKSCLDCDIFALGAALEAY